MFDMIVVRRGEERRTRGGAGERRGTGKGGRVTKLCNQKR
jgi:hypothetical protein